MNNSYISYEDYILMDREYRMYEERMEYIMNKYITSVDRDDIDYPPCEYWESGL